VEGVLVNPASLIANQRYHEGVKYGKKENCGFYQAAVSGR
jgi:hypothetical protein